MIHEIPDTEKYYTENNTTDVYKKYYIIKKELDDFEELYEIIDDFLNNSRIIDNILSNCSNKNISIDLYFLRTSSEFKYNFKEDLAWNGDQLNCHFDEIISVVFVEGELEKINNLHYYFRKPSKTNSLGYNETLDEFEFDIPFKKNRFKIENVN